MDFIHKFKRPIKVLAPMVNNSDQAYRLLAKNYGADLCYTEMVHCKQFLLSKSDGQRNKWFTTDSSEADLVVQLCGNDPQIMLEVAQKVQPFCSAIDVNFGCPQNIAKRGNYGAFLQDDLKLTGEIVKTLSHGLSVPVFCKVRIFNDVGTTLSYVRMIQDSGCSLLAVHGRTREQRGVDTGLADWDQIRMVKDSLHVPVLSNGNVLCREDVYRAAAYTKCDGVMVAESHLYNPLIFTEQRKSCFEIVKEYLEICRDIKTRTVEIKSHVFKILHKALENEGELKEKISSVANVDEIWEILQSIKPRIGLIEPTQRIRGC